MRKLILLSSVFMLSFGVFVNNDAHAISGFSTEGTLKNLLNEHKEFAKETAENIARLAEQNNAGGAKQTEATGNQLDALSTNSAITAQQTAAAGVAMSNSNTAEAICPALSATISDSAVEANAERVAEAFYQDQLKYLKGEGGYDSEFGVIDQARKKYAKRTGTTKDIDVSSWMNNPSLPSDPTALAEALVSLGYVLGEAVEAIPQDIKDNPDTNAQYAITTRDRILGREAIAYNLVQEKLKFRVGYEGASAEKTLRERLVACKVPDEDIEKMFASGLSRKIIFDTLTDGSSCPAMVNQELIKTDSDLKREIAFQLMLNNRLLNQQLAFSESLINAEISNIANGLEEQKKELNNKIRAIRRGQ